MILSAEGIITEAIFLICVFITIVGGGIAIWARPLIHAVFGLALSLIGVAGLYFYLGSPFVALMQILIYIGAVCVVIIFAIMLAEPLGYTSTRGQGTRHILLGLVSGLPLTILFIFGVLQTSWLPDSNRLTDGSVFAIGKHLILEYGLVFELMSVVLLIAIVGSIILAWGGRETRDKK